MWYKKKRSWLSAWTTDFIQIVKFEGSLNRCYNETTWKYISFLQLNIEGQTTQWYFLEYLCEAGVQWWERIVTPEVSFHNYSVVIPLDIEIFHELICMNHNHSCWKSYIKLSISLEILKMLATISEMAYLPVACLCISD